MQKGSVRVLIFNNPDYTRLISENRVTFTSTGAGGGFNFTLNEDFDPVFSAQTQQYSLVLQGAVRFDNSSFYNLTFASNLKFEVYLDRKLIA